MQAAGLRALFLAGVLSALLSGPAAAEPLTLDAALARANAANSALRATGQDIETARANLERSKAWVPQNPYVSGGLLQQPQTGFGPNYGVNISQEFEIAGQRSKRIEVAEAGLQKAEWELRNEKLGLEASVKTAFIHALISEERVALATRGAAAVADLGTHPGKGTGESHAGMTIDRNQFLIQEARSRRDVGAAELGRDEAFDSLRYLLGLAPGQAIELTGAAEHAVRPLRADSELVDAALEKRPDLLALEHDADRADKQVPLVRREGIPNVTLSGSYSRFEDSNFAGGDIAFYVPVWRGNEPEMMEALAERSKTQFQVEDLKRSIEREVRQARRICMATAEDLELSQTVIVPRSRENLELQRARFDRSEVGAAELIGLLIDAQEAEKDYLDAVQAYNDAWIDLERAVAGDL